MKKINSIIGIGGFLLSLIFFACGGGGGGEDTPAEKLDVSPATVNAVKESKEYTVTVESNVNWTVSCDSSWCRPLQLSNAVKLAVEANPYAKVRSAIVSVKGVTLIRKVTVTQAAATPDPGTEQLEIESSPIVSSYKNATYRVDVTANVDWSVSSNKTWCLVTRNNSQINVELELNEDQAERFAVITVKGGSLQRTLDITQEGITSRGVDSLALVTFYNTTQGANWKQGWQMNTSLTTWKGVKLDAAGERVEELVLRDNGLTGNIPSAIGELTALKKLELGKNALTGFPATIGQLEQLEYLSADSNQLQGTFPATFKNLKKLRILELGYNQLETTDLSATGITSFTQLVWLGLAGNELSGILPEGLGNLKKLAILDLSLNSFGGSIPDSWMSNLFNLEYFYLHGNQLNETLPAGLVNLNRLKALALDHNELTGTIPDDLGNLPALEGLWLYENQLNGVIPSSLLNNRYWAQWKEYVCPQKGEGFEDGCPSVRSAVKNDVAYFKPDKNLYY